MEIEKTGQWILMSSNLLTKKHFDLLLFEAKLCEFFLKIQEKCQVFILSLQLFMSWPYNLLMLDITQYVRMSIVLVRCYALPINQRQPQNKGRHNYNFNWKSKYNLVIFCIHMWRNSFDPMLFLLRHHSVGIDFVHYCHLSTRKIERSNEIKRWGFRIFLNIVKYLDHLEPFWICNSYYIKEKHWLCVEGFLKMNQQNHPLILIFQQSTTKHF